LVSILLINIKSIGFEWIVNGYCIFWERVIGGYVSYKRRYALKNTLNVKYSKFSLLKTLISILLKETLISILFKKITSKLWVWEKFHTMLSPYTRSSYVMQPFKSNLSRFIRKVGSKNNYFIANRTMQVP